MIVSFIAAMGTNGVIGRDGKLPWHLPGDLKRFRAITWGKPIIMGRKTHESLGRPLPGRTNIILTRQPDFSCDGLPGRAFPGRSAGHCRGGTGQRKPSSSAAVRSSRRSFRRCEKIYLTIVEGEFEGDTYFPVSMLGSPDWEIVREEPCPADERNRFSSRYEVYQRRD